MLYSPLVKLYTVISGETEGIYLFMRQAFLIYKILIAGILVLLFKRSFPLLLSLLFLLPYLALAPHSMGNFSYNTFSLSLLLISCALVFTALRKNEKYDRQFSVLGGVAAALTILAHPMQLITAVSVLILLFIFERKRYKTLFRVWLFAVGGFITAAAVLIYLSTLSGGIRPVFDGIVVILKQPYFHIRKVSLADNIGELKGTLVLFGRFLLIGFAAFAGLSLMSFILRKRIKADIKTLFVLALFFTELLYVTVYIYRYRHSEYYYLPLNVCMF